MPRSCRKWASMSQEHKTVLEVEAVVKYDILPEEGDLPQQIDITEVLLSSTNPQTGKVRKINILHTLSAAEVINLEDEIAGVFDDVD